MDTDRNPVTFCEIETGSLNKGIAEITGDNKAPDKHEDISQSWEIT